MAIITNYSTLVQAIQNVTEDDGAEFVTYIPTAIALAEERLFKELELPTLDEKDTGNLTASANTLTKPTGYKFADFLSVDVLGVKHVLKKKRESFINDYWPSATAVGAPKYYCDTNDTTFIIAPTPEAAYAYELKYTKQPTKLSSSNETNYFVTNCSDTLFPGAVLEMVKFMKAWSQVQIWEQNFVQSRDTWNIEMMRYRRDGGELPANTDSGPNSLKHTMPSNA